MRIGESREEISCMTEGEAKQVVNRARHQQMLLNFKSPEETGKKGKSRKRYEMYWKMSTFTVHWMGQHAAQRY